ncbi:hypothetical protein EC973_005108 [Apophysomyces ossiformis]|uniref:factor independent urate hydroxylase n=1 Tax=Apophysomyces ossiformis TaxID=679940 RepID=A0A8H7BG99_9FUNG|nr:hypothetical protein EC973_005108 [Apophysomyces ossiformis]
MGNIVSTSSTHSEHCPVHANNKRKLSHDEQGSVKRLRAEDQLIDEENEISEERAGITAFVNPELVGFQCIIKNRQEDFLVNEVDLEGNVVHLTSLEKPVIDNKIDKQILDAVEFDARVKEILGSDFASQLRQLLDCPDEKEKIVKVKTEKTNRAKFYRLIEKHLEETLATSCKEGELIVGWPQDGDESRSVFVDFNRVGEYLQFYVYKSGVDTMGAVNIISSATNIPRKRIGYAGTKDARAVTVQAMTMHRVYPSDLFNASESLKERGIYIGNFSFCKTGLVLGDLSGNRFNIVLRDVTGANEEQITKSLQSLKENGFINYFGMQRFGTSTVMTHEIGREIMKKNYEAAAHLILNPREGDRADFNIARNIWQDTGNAQLALDKFPKRASSERTLLASYVRFPDDHQKAIQSLPRNMLFMYSHAYQSYIWNRVVSERAKRFGCSGPIVGDIVMVDPAPTSGKKQTRNNQGRREQGKRQVPKVLTEEDVGNYAMEDVVYPLPGKRTIYPENEIGGLYKQLLEEDGISQTDGHFEKFMRYDDPTVKLCNTDVDHLEGKPEPADFPDLVRLLRVYRQGEWQTCTELTVRLMLEGEIDIAYTKGDNAPIVATDTCKNTVNIIAKRSSNVDNIEVFAQEITEHVLKQYGHIHVAHVEIIKHKWTRIPVDGKPHPHSFFRDGDDIQTAKVKHERAGNKVTVISGLKNLLLLKTTGSAFHGFYKDEYTVLPEVWDRIFSTAVDSTWTFGPAPADVLRRIDYPAIHEGVRKITLETFATDASASVQATLYLMQERILAKYPEVEEVFYSLPNKHYVGMDLSKFNIDNTGKNMDVYLPLADPSGLITATTARKPSSKL